MVRYCKEWVEDSDGLWIAKFPVRSDRWNNAAVEAECALTVLDADDPPQLRLLGDELQRWSERPDADRVELFRRMVFNALISNPDDHPRNHALIATGVEWRLAPAYDLTPEPRPGRRERLLAMTCGPYGRWARRGNLSAAALRFGRSADQAEAIITDMRVIVGANWLPEVQRFGATAADCEWIAEAFVDPGFECEVPLSE